MNTAPLAALNHIPPHLQTIADYQKQAQLHLDAATWANLEGAAGDEYSLNNNLTCVCRYSIIAPSLKFFCRGKYANSAFRRTLSPPNFFSPRGLSTTVSSAGGNCHSASGIRYRQAPMILSHLSTTSMATH